mmetsp:Transcript_3762/g.11211  ORF Transcript_3762/g.11211 Transcript_3762/m.11211 type:complete len:192 (-) Transcript_3762:365-940(-)|eukprot:CAMPEP_0198736608 /NCGR_PEP_ID=MMETSP1475-20131203/66952_1 /TAXON_ID= ORGANISM="Unidentified sp., Strain CCMP1999" /NCGR_SAMPLE_ID=MMETSP1475 /ASSEMBLY_ACC=CAM_ASM_001111 /LENGTH=191 /DNA_ID=CAMNT_0044500445 /DNA_START=294 /DNA_END=869 /DNA_ORIENTATION=+
MLPIHIILLACCAGFATQLVLLLVIYCLLKAKLDLEARQRVELRASRKEHPRSVEELDLKAPEKIYTVADVELGETMSTQCKDTSCAVCLDAIEEGHKIRSLPCKHDFHTECITPWLIKSARCPLCNDPLFEDQEKHLSRAASRNSDLQSASDIGSEMEVIDLESLPDMDAVREETSGLERPRRRMWALFV